jgi:hypothetical protein
MGIEIANQLAEALTLLEHRLSPKRRAGAKRLRKIRKASAGPTLLKALQKELRDPRTWETQYQMIMALGESNYRRALPYLRSLIHQPFTATMLYTALGDAIVRLGRQHSNDPAPYLNSWGWGTTS